MEADAGLVARSRAVFERALAIDYTYVPLWLRYSQMEAKAQKFSNASEVLSRATGLLPFQPKLWLRHLEYEEIRQRDEHCREILADWVSATNSSQSWKFRYQFERKHSSGLHRLQEIAQSWTKALPNDPQAWKALVFCAGGEVARDKLAAACQSGDLSPQDLTAIIAAAPELEGRTEPAETHADKDPASNGSDIELWWATANLYPDDTRSILSEAAQKCLPQMSAHKTLEWRKFALLWLRIALDVEKSSSGEPEKVYEQALQNWDHSKFTSATLWRSYAYYFLRQNNLERCRKVFGSALAKTKCNPSGHQHILQDYINLETQLLETDRVRKLYGIMCAEWPQVAANWISFAKFEAGLNESERASRIYEVAVDFSDNCDNPDSLWIEWAELVGDRSLDQARAIWEKAVRASNSPAEMYALYAMFEVGTGLDPDAESVEADADAIERARQIFERGCEILGSSEAEPSGDQYDLLTELFIEFEETYGTPETADLLRHTLDTENPAASTLEIDDNAEASPHSLSDQMEDGEDGDEHSQNFEEGATKLSAIERLMANAQKWKSSQTTEHSAEQPSAVASSSEPSSESSGETSSETT